MARPQQYAMNHQPHYPPPRNPFQGKGRNILPRYSPAPQREGSLARAVKQACVVLLIGTVLVSALSLAVPPAPADVNSMAAPRAPTGLRKGGGVRSQSRVRAVKKHEDSRNQNTSHHWDADTLQQENEVPAYYDDVSSDDSPAAKASKEELAAKIESKTKEQNAVADGAFGRREDVKVGSAGGDQHVDADSHRASKGHVIVDALDSDDTDSKDMQRGKKDVKVLLDSEDFPSERNGDSHADSDDENGTEKSPDTVSDEAGDKKEVDSREESAGDAEGSEDGNIVDSPGEDVDQDSKPAVPKRVGDKQDIAVAKVSRKIDAESQAASKDNDKQDKDLGSNDQVTSTHKTIKEEASGDESRNKVEKESVQVKTLDSALDRTERVARVVPDDGDESGGNRAYQNAPTK